MKSSDWPATRIVHLPGGVRAVNELTRTVRIIPKAVNGAYAEFQINRYPDLFQSLSSVGMQPIGAEFITHENHATGVWPTEWRALDARVSAKYLSFDANQLWGNLVHSAHKANDYDLVDLAGRIGFQIEACEYRLKEISDAYHKQIMSICAQGEFDENHGIESPWTFPIYFAVHSFFIDCCTLRDYLAEFVSEYALTGSCGKITTMAKLRGCILRKAEDDDPLLMELCRITDSEANGWLSEVGDYRDLIVHSTPLSRAEGRMFLVQNLLSINGDKCMPSISFPLPDNPHEIKVKRSRGIRFSGFKEWSNATREKVLSDSPIIDALDYCSIVNGRIMDLALRLIVYAPLNPERLEITSDDISELVIR